MPNQHPASPFAESIPVGIVSFVCGIGAVSAIAQNLFLACLCGIASFSLGILALKTKPEKLDKTFAIGGITLAFAPVVYLLINMG